MGKIAEEFQECLAKGRIQVFADASKLIGKQLQIAESDLHDAKEGMRNNRWHYSLSIRKVQRAYCSRRWNVAETIEQSKINTRHRLQRPNIESAWHIFSHIF